MCEDGTQWQRHEADYDKHIPPAGLDRAEIIRRTSKPGAISRYLPGIDKAVVEMAAAREGVYVSCGGDKGHKMCKACHFPYDIGASEGNASRWVIVESTNGAYHGHPMSERAYLLKLKSERKCCNEQ
jgi:hypothetical protein